MAGAFAHKPLGIILHGSRSGQQWSVAREFDSCRNFAAGGANGLGWNATVGEDEYSVHMTAQQWGWNARSPASQTLLAVELAQAQLVDPITDAQVRAFVAWYRAEVVSVWGDLDLSNDGALPTHAELRSGIDDGKTDVFERGSPRTDDLRARIRAAL